MAHRLDTRSSDFEAAFEAVLAVERAPAVDVEAVVAEIVERVRVEGDAAVIAYTDRFDQLQLTPESLRIGTQEIEAAAARAAPETLAALALAATRIEAFHSRQLPADDSWADAHGNRLGHRWRPISAVGIYVPGGTAAYPSSVLMNALPAKVAGVPRVAMVVPTPSGALEPLVLAAAGLAGVDEIYRIGGAQAVAALAFGTETIPPVDKIVGPGNAYVAAAKRQVFGTVGIDLIAGPSEILVVADGDNDPAWIAADLLSQAEHDTAAQAVLITDDAGFADAVVGAVEDQLEGLQRSATAAASWRRHGAVVLVADLAAEAPALVDRMAPEHLQLALAEPEALADRISNAGAIFLGRLTPEAVGDYVAGPNHDLPTGRSARFSSGLSVLDFMKRTSLVGMEASGLAALGPAAVRLAEAEGLQGHARSIALRLEQSD